MFSTTFPDFIASGLIPSDTSIQSDLTQNTSGVVLAAVIRYPLGGRWEAFGRLGRFLSGTLTGIDSTELSGGIGGPSIGGAFFGRDPELSGTLIGSPPAMGCSTLGRQCCHQVSVEWNKTV